MKSLFFAAFFCLFGIASLYAEDLQEKFRRLNQESAQFYQEGKKREAILAAEEALRIATQLDQQKSIVNISAQIRLADLYRHYNQLQEAGKLYAQALEGQEEILGSTHPEVAETLYKLASLNAFQNRFVEAEHLLETALSIQEENRVRPNDPGLLKIREALEKVRSEQKK